MPNINKTVLDNAKCACPEHQGKEMLNQVYNLSVNYLWECLFGHTVFCSKYWESRKFFNMKIGDWKSIESFPARQLEYQVDLGGAIGRPKNTETQVRTIFFIKKYNLHQSLRFSQSLKSFYELFKSINYQMHNFLFLWIS